MKAVGCVDWVWLVGRGGGLGGGRGGRTCRAEMRAAQCGKCGLTGVARSTIMAVAARQDGPSLITVLL